MTFTPPLTTSLIGRNNLSQTINLFFTKKQAANKGTIWISVVVMHGAKGLVKKGRREINEQAPQTRQSQQRRKLRSKNEEKHQAAVLYAINPESASPLGRPLIPSPKRQNRKRHV
jgi:hypothetical protein